MDLKSGFFNSINGDRVYTADDMMYPYKGIVSNGVIASDTYSEGLQVKAKESLQVTVKAGFGIFNGKWAELEQDTTFDLAPPHVTLSRIDSFVVRVDLTTEGRKVSLEYLQSTPAGDPVPPTLNNTDALRDYRLCNILVAPNATEITQAEITDTRPTSECGFVTNLLQDSDISATYEQWQEQFRQWLANNGTHVETLVNQLDTEFNDWSDAKKEEYETFVTNTQAEYDTYTDAKKSEYNTFVSTEQANYENFVTEHETFILEHEQAIAQEREEYETWTQEKQQAYDEWFNSLTDELLVKEAFFHYGSVYTATTDGETNIPINISAFSADIDILTVYINGLRLIANVDYTLNGYQSITLTKGIDAGTVVSFDLLKIVVTSDIETVINELQRIIKLIPTEATETNKLADKAYVDSVAGGGGGAELEEIQKLIPVEATEENKLADKAFVNTSIDNLEDAILVANPAYTEMLWEQIQEGATETPISTPERIEEIWEAIQEASSGGTGDVTLHLSTHSVNYTYVVDSDQKLNDWAKNVAGNDYTSVLIRKGEWTTTTGVNLTTTGTKVVVGEAGSKLVFTASGTTCLRYANQPTTNDYYMHGVNIDGVISSVCFDKCINLTNCNGIAITTSKGFTNCKNLTNCVAVGKGSYMVSGFEDCTNLINCKGSGEGGSDAYGFNGCTNLTNCDGTAKSSSAPSGFNGCANLTNCNGTGEGGSNGYGFQGCTLMSKCKAGDHCTTRVFNVCYASKAKVADYTCADSPAGGFNDPTNPA